MISQRFLNNTIFYDNLFHDLKKREKTISETFQNKNKYCKKIIHNKNN